MSSRDETIAIARSLILPDDAPDRLTQFVDLWLSRRRSKPIPLFEDIDPLDMPWALPHVFVVGCEDHDIFRYRLVGEEMRWRLGGHLVGKTASDVFEADYAGLVETRWRRVVSGPSVCYAVTRHKTAQQKEISASRVILPTLSHRGQIERLIGVSVFHTKDSYPADLIGQGSDIHVDWTDIADIPST